MSHNEDSHKPDDIFVLVTGANRYECNPMVLKSSSCLTTKEKEIYWG